METSFEGKKKSNLLPCDDPLISGVKCVLADFMIPSANKLKGDAGFIF